jgi:hypothetical protein
VVEDDRGEGDAAEVAEGVFVVAGGDAAPLLQACEAAFGGVASTNGWRTSALCAGWVLTGLDGRAEGGKVAAEVKRQLAGRPASPPAESPNKSVALRSGHLLHSRQTANRPRRSEMRQAFMTIQKGIATYSEDMTLDANVELGDFGACRRR